MKDELLDSLIIEALQAAEKLDVALRAAAKLLASCTCQAKRKQQADQACELATDASKQWDDSQVRLMRYVERRKAGLN